MVCEEALPATRLPPRCQSPARSIEGQYACDRSDDAERDIVRSETRASGSDSTGKRAFALRPASIRIGVGPYASIDRNILWCNGTAVPIGRLLLEIGGRLAAAIPALGTRGPYRARALTRKQQLDRRSGVKEGK
ncbi:hypothetical protein DFR76_101575 [Nocardia pseudobrasiliensis]|uniref:Uncharacterized protein n=2 Tax=Nocardia pseudobrasiliensis TaxID=45979 RepID=A0A370IE88_9NOCA|nr:hypothetical protein DFR76_101575 [Nocardia pseudobrasiliensis]